MNKASVIHKAVVTLCCAVSFYNMSWAQVLPKTCEYWIDYQYEQRVASAFEGSSWTQELDMSNLAPGIHTIGLHVQDSEGRWGSAMLRHFIVTRQLNDISENHITEYRCWIDYDIDNAQTGTTDGVITLKLNSIEQGLAKGVHTLHYQVKDSRGMYGPAMVQHFIITPDVETVTGIAAYEYWFNYGPRKRVEVEPTVPMFVLTDEVIDIADVVPNSIPADYSFDSETETVYVDDNVFFGIQAFDDAGHPSGAVLSDKFAMTVPVNPQMKALETAEPLEFAAPRKGHIQGFKSECNITDSLTWVVSQTSAFAAYDAEGNRLQLSKTKLNDGSYVYSTQSPTTTVYALIHDVSEAIDTMTITYIRTVPTAIEHPASSSATEAIYDLNGRRITKIRRGVNIVRISDGSVKKVMVH